MVSPDDEGRSAPTFVKLPDDYVPAPRLSARALGVIHHTAPWPPIVATPAPGR